MDDPYIKRKNYKNRKFIAKCSSLYLVTLKKKEYVFFRFWSYLCVDPAKGHNSIQFFCKSVDEIKGSSIIQIQPFTCVKLLMILSR